MTDAAHLATAILAVSLGYFLRTVVPYLNKKKWNKGIRFERRYLVAGASLYIVSLYTALTTIDALPDLVQGSLGGTFLAYLLLAVATNHGVFEAMDKAKAPASSRA